MKNPIPALFLAVAFSLATCGVAHGMSELVALTLEPVSPTLDQPVNVFVYEITVERAGQGLLKVELSADGLPEGATALFSPSTVRFTGRTPATRTALMTITCTSLTPNGTYTFAVTGQARRESITITNQFKLSLNALVVRLPVLHLDPPSATGANLRGEGTSGQTYRIESTQDLINPVWTPIASTTAGPDGTFNYLVENIREKPMQFFRAVIPPAAPASRQCSGH